MKKKSRLLVLLLIIIGVIGIFTYKNIENKKVENTKMDTSKDGSTVLEVTTADIEEL
ncbi:MAG: hypothetical protein PHS82_13150 [Lachnospiraceae bacterium]|nr:hypothetical protein [Lachnospiraceae bacterium]